MPDIQMAPYVLAGYLGLWAILIGYLIFQGLRLTRLERELKHLEEVARKKD